MKPKTLILGVLLIFLLTLQGISAQTDLADWQYDTASNAYSVGDCKNASIHAEIALDRYTADNSIVGITKTGELIRKINDCLWITADSNYRQSLNLLSEGSSYLNSGNYQNAKKSLDMAKVYLSRASSNYDYMISPDTRISKGLDDIEKLSGNIDSKLAETYLVEADSLYDRSLDFFENADYVNSMIYANQAYALFEEYGSESDLARVKLLRERLGEEILTLQQRAGYLYEKGVEDYSSANCTNGKYLSAMEYFQNARDTYIIINDFDSVEDLDYLINQTSDAIKNCGSVMLSELDDQLEIATTRLLLAKECTEYDSIRSDLLGLKQNSEELYVIFELKAFKSITSQADDLIEDVDKKAELCSGTQNAEKIYEQSYSAFQTADYEAAHTFVLQAIELFGETQNWGGITKSEKLRDDIEDMLSRLNESNDIYNQSLIYNDVADYENALMSVLRARDIYQNISRIEDVAKCNQTIKDIKKGNDTKNSAKELYELALKQLRYREYGNAIESVEKARELYEKINYAEGVKEAQELREQIPDPPRSSHTVFIVVIVSVLFIFVIWTRSRVMRDRREKEEKASELRKEQDEKEFMLEAERIKRETEKEKMMAERNRMRELLEVEKKTMKSVTTEKSSKKTVSPRKSGRKKKENQLSEEKTPVLASSAKSEKDDSQPKDTSGLKLDALSEKEKLKEFLKKERQALRDDLSETGNSENGTE